MTTRHERALGMRAAADVLSRAADALIDVAKDLRAAADELETKPFDLKSERYRAWIRELVPAHRVVGGVLALVAGEAGRRGSRWTDIAKAAGEPDSTLHDRWAEGQLTKDAVAKVDAGARGRL